MPNNNPITINFPLLGEWQFLRPPDHHPFAFDFVKTDDSRKNLSRYRRAAYFYSHIPASEYFCWDEPVYSPIDGTVIQTGDGWADTENTNIWITISKWFNATYRFRPDVTDGRLDIRPNAGNYIMIQSKEGYIVFLAHLRNTSIKVHEGQSVSAGELIANVGNSGNSTMPHLHINLFDQMSDPLSANVIPFVFTDYLQLDNKGHWHKYTSHVPGVKSFIKI